MSPAQSKLARSLLKEAIDWIGMTDLSVNEDELAEEVQARIERLLVDLGDLPGPGTGARIEDLYRVVLSTRAHCERAEHERDECRRRLHHALEAGDPLEYMTRRLQVAISQWEEADRAQMAAEAAYYRGLVSGGHRCSVGG
jgi:hypothetical protein